MIKEIEREMQIYKHIKCFLWWFIWAMAAVIYYSRKKINIKMGLSNILAAMLACSLYYT